MDPTWLGAGVDESTTSKEYSLPEISSSDEIRTWKESYDRSRMHKALGFGDEFLSCWALLLATLTSLAIKVSSERLKFARLLDEKQLVLQGKKGMANIREAENLVWRNAADSYEQWLDGEYDALFSKHTEFNEVLNPWLGTYCRKPCILITESEKRMGNAYKTRDLPARALASVLMLRVLKTTIGDPRGLDVRHHPRSVPTFTWTNFQNVDSFPHALYLDLYNGSMEAMEENVREVDSLLADLEYRTGSTWNGRWKPRHGCVEGVHGEPARAEQAKAF
ncbi:hypothetical protein ACLOJK_033690 [Asimina triloba]